MPRPDAFGLPWAGGCHCGLVRYRADEAPKFTFACHGTDCPKLSASAFAIGILLPVDGVAGRNRELAEYAKTADTGMISLQNSCRACGTGLYIAKDNTLETIILWPASLDARDWVRPIAEIFTASARPWARLSTAFSLPVNVEAPECPSA